MKRTHQKAYTISDMTEEERLELADLLEAELKALDKDIAAGNAHDIDPAMVKKMKTLTADIEIDLDEPIDGDVVISGSGNVFADLGLENAKELKAMADNMIAEGIPEDQIVSVLQSITPNDGEMSEGYYHHVLLIEEIRKTTNEVPDEPKSENK